MYIYHNKTKLKDNLINFQIFYKILKYKYLQNSNKKK